MTHDPRDPPVRRSVELTPAERQHPDTAVYWAVAAIRDVTTDPESDQGIDDGDARWLGRYLHSLYGLHVERGG